MASSQPSTRTARPTSVSSTDSAAAPPWRTRTWRRTASALLPGGQLADADRTRRLPRRQDGAGDAALAQGGQRGLRRAPPVDHDGGDAGADGGLEGGVPAVVDLHQVDQRAHDAVDVAQQLAPAGALQVGQRALQRLGAGRSAVPRLLGLVRRHLGRLRRAARPPRARRCAPPAPPPAQPSPVPARRPAGPGGRRAPRHPPSAPRRVSTRAPSASRSSCSRAAARTHRLRCGRAPGRWPGRAHRRRAPWPSAPAAPPPRPSRVARAASSSARSGAPPASSSASAVDQLAGQAGRLGLEGRDHVDVGRGIEGGHHAPARARAARR